MRTLRFYDSRKEMKKDVNKLRKDGFLILQVNDYNLSVSFSKEEN
jgi:biotin operon repressor